MQTPEVREQMFEYVKGWQTSGLSQKKFCEQSNIPYHVFHYWYKLYRRTESKVSSSFIKLEVPSTDTPFAELVLPDGKKLLFHQPLSLDYLKALIN